jgi:Fe-S cluster biogenesis protein NfuA
LPGGRDTVGTVVDSPQLEPILKACRDILAPLIRADGGEMYLVSATAEDIHIHLAGTCAGCPGATMTRDRLLEPAIAAVAPKANLRVTTGWRVPDGARKIGEREPPPAAKPGK